MWSQRTQRLRRDGSEEKGMHSPIPSTSGGGARKGAAGSNTDEAEAPSEQVPGTRKGKTGEMPLTGIPEMTRGTIPHSRGAPASATSGTHRGLRTEAVTFGIQGRW